MVLESHCGIYMDVSVYYLYVCKLHASVGFKFKGHMHTLVQSILRVIDSALHT